LGPEAAGEADFLIGRMYLARGEFDGAKQAATAAARAAPTAVAPRVLLSHILLKEGKDAAAAERALRDVLAIDPNHAEALHNLSALRMRSGAG
jgi:cytochrome c-type biogenesis protein CcmH/NrfG